jgi:hypothetical protein
MHYLCGYPFSSPSANLRMNQSTRNLVLLLIFWAATLSVFDYLIRLTCRRAEKLFKQFQTRREYSDVCNTHVAGISAGARKTGTIYSVTTGADLPAHCDGCDHNCCRSLLQVVGLTVHPVSLYSGSGVSNSSEDMDRQKRYLLATGGELVGIRRLM